MAAAMNIEGLSNAMEKRLAEIASCSTMELLFVTHYGANHIHPKYLVYWICVRTDAEKRRLQADSVLMTRLRKVLDDFRYPIEGRDSVHIGFESKETVDRESKGNWYYHWK